MKLELGNPRVLKLVAVFGPQAVQLGVTSDELRHELVQLHTQIRWPLGHEFLQSVVQQRHRAPEVAPLKMMKRDGDLNEPLQKEPSWVTLFAPLGFQHFVHLEKQVVIKQERGFAQRHVTHGVARVWSPMV